MFQKYRFVGTVMAMVCLLATIAIWTPASSASEIETMQTTSVLAETRDGKHGAYDGVQMMYSFNPENNEYPEGITIDKKGNIYVSVGTAFWLPDPDPFGEIWQINPDGEISLLHEFPGGPGAAGLTVSPSGVLYFGYPNPGYPNNGVYRKERGGAAEKLPGSEAIIVANGLALSKQGDLYVSDSALGTIWRFPNGIEDAEVWFQHPWIAGCDPVDAPFGANGIAFWKDSLYVANTFRGMLVRVPVMEDGTAGAPEILAGDEECDFDDLFSMDGIALDVHGNVYALLVMQHKLVRINPEDGSHTVLLTEEDGLFNTSSIAFGTGRQDRQYVFMSNFALLEPGPEGNLGPGVLKYYVGVPGLPLP